MRDDGLTDEEGEVMDALCDAVDAFEALERQHPQEEEEFFLSVHRIQDLLAVRAMRRLHPKGWVTFH